jgi:NAD dependent epimerase/dehydratase family enzyme
LVCTTIAVFSNTEKVRLSHVTNCGAGVPAFKWMLKIGTKLIGTEPELVLKSRWVVPTRLQKEKFEFRYAQLEDAMKDIVSKVPRKRYHLF